MGRPAQKKAKKARTIKGKKLETRDEFVSLDHEMASMDDHEIVTFKSGKTVALKRKLSEKENDHGSAALAKKRKNGRSY